jgi:hypothetical protein
MGYLSAASVRIGQPADGAHLERNSYQPRAGLAQQERQVRRSIAISEADQAAQLQQRRFHRGLMVYCKQ